MRSLADNLAPLRVVNFRWFLASLILLTLATEIEGTALGWQVFQLTHRYQAIGYIGLAEAIPNLAVALFAGHLSDRLDRRRLGIASATVLLLGAVLLLLVSRHPVGGLLAPLYLLSALSGIGRSFFGPARSALGAELIERSLYAQAVSLRSGSWQMAVIVGPGVGGLLIRWGQGAVTLAYAVAAALLAVGIGCLIAVRHRSPPQATRRESVGASLREGLRFVGKERNLLAAMTLDLFAVLFGGAQAMLPAFAEQVLHVGPRGYGWLRSGQAIGAVLMWVVLGLLPPLPRAGRTMLWAVAIFGLAWMGVAYCPWFPLTLALLILAGAADYVSVVVRSTLVQSLTPGHLLGRVSSVNSIFIGSSNEIGAFESGIAAQWLGLQRSVFIGSAITLVVVATTARLAGGLRRLGRLDTLRPSPAAAAPVEPPPPPSITSPP